MSAEILYRAVLAVADWLDGTADEPWCCDECKFDPENDNRLIHQVRAVARALLLGHQRECTTGDCGDCETTGTKGGAA